MLVGLESGVFHRRTTGIANYTFNIAWNALEQNAALRFFGFQQFGWHQYDLDSLRNTALVFRRGKLREALASAPLLRKIYRKLNEWTFASSVQKQSIDLFHAFNFQPLADPGVPILPVVYDISTFRYPEFHPTERVRWLETLPATLERGRLVQTISEFSKREIGSFFSFPLDRIIVAPPAASSLFVPLGPTITQCDIDSLQLFHGSYFLAVGTLEPRKNMRTLISAYARLSQKTRSQFPLVVVGGKGWGDLNLPRESDALVREGSLRFLLTVPSSRLRSLYEGARLFVMPSFYEGFGMPVVEALACGTPIAHSADTAMDEIADGLAMRVSAFDVLGWTDVLESAAANNFHIDATLRERRIARAQFFSWKRSANIVLEAYAQILGDPYRPPFLPESALTK